MKNLVKIIAILVIMASISTVPAQASTIYDDSPRNQAIQLLLNAASERCIIESQWLEEFRPDDPATIADFLDMAYSIAVLRNKGGFPDVKNHAIKKESKWLKGLYVDAMFAEPERATELATAYMDGHKKFKTSNKLSYAWATTACQVIINRCSDSLTAYGEWTDEGIENLIMEIRQQWGYTSADDTMTRLECLQLIIDMLDPDLPQGPGFTM